MIQRMGARPLVAGRTIGQQVARRLHGLRSRPRIGRAIWRPARLRSVALARHWPAPRLLPIALRIAEPGYGNAARTAVWRAVHPYPWPVRFPGPAEDGFAAGAPQPPELPAAGRPAAPAAPAAPAGPAQAAARPPAAAAPPPEPARPALDAAGEVRPPGPTASAEPEATAPAQPLRAAPQPPAPQAPVQRLPPQPPATPRPRLPAQPETSAPAAQLAPPERARPAGQRPSAAVRKPLVAAQPPAAARKPLVQVRPLGIAAQRAPLITPPPRGPAGLPLLLRREAPAHPALAAAAPSEWPLPPAAAPGQALLAGEPMPMERGIQRPVSGPAGEGAPPAGEVPQAAPAPRRPAGSRLAAKPTAPMPTARPADRGRLPGSARLALSLPSLGRVAQTTQRRAAYRAGAPELEFAAGAALPAAVSPDLDATPSAGVAAPRPERARPLAGDLWGAESPPGGVVSAERARPALPWAGRPLPPREGRPVQRAAVEPPPTIAPPATPAGPVPAVQAAAVEAEAAAAPDAAAGAGPAAAAPTEAQGAPEVDLDAVARQVYEILRRRLHVERERTYGRSA